MWWYWTVGTNRDGEIGIGRLVEMRMKVGAPKVDQLGKNEKKSKGMKIKKLIFSNSTFDGHKWNFIRKT